MPSDRVFQELLLGFSSLLDSHERSSRLVRDLATGMLDEPEMHAAVRQADADLDHIQRVRHFVLMMGRNDRTAH